MPGPEEEVESHAGAVGEEEVHNLNKAYWKHELLPILPVLVFNPSLRTLKLYFIYFAKFNRSIFQPPLHSLKIGLFKHSMFRFLSRSTLH